MINLLIIIIFIGVSIVPGINRHNEKMKYSNNYLAGNAEKILVYDTYDNGYYK